MSRQISGCGLHHCFAYVEDHVRMGVKTVRRLVILILTILVVSLSIFLIQRYQVSRMNRSVLARAARAEKDSKFDEAAAALSGTP